MADEDFLGTVQAFVREKWKPHNPCERCGSFEWSILPGTENVISVNASNAEMSSRGSSHDAVEFVPVYCNNCGNTVNIFIGVFMEWLVKKSRQTT